VGQYTLPSATWHDFSQLIGHEIAALCLKLLVLRNINNVLHLFFVDTLVVMHFSLVANSLQPVQVQVKIEVA